MREHRIRNGTCPSTYWTGADLLEPIHRRHIFLRTKQQINSTRANSVTKNEFNPDVKFVDFLSLCRSPPPFLRYLWTEFSSVPSVPPGFAYLSSFSK